MVVLPAPFGPEQTVDRAGRNAKADAVDGASFAELLDEVDRLHREALIGPFVLSRSKHCFP